MVKILPLSLAIKAFISHISLQCICNKWTIFLEKILTPKLFCIELVIFIPTFIEREREKKKKRERKRGGSVTLYIGLIFLNYNQ